ncbi:MAG TPA: hypothetical protein VGM21_10825 [Actinomycetota bacterium]|jgi:hypothetical protein
MRTVERDLATVVHGRLSARRQVPFALLAAAAVAAAAVVWLALPREREVASAWELLAKLVPFVLATEAIARMDRDLVRRRWLARVALPAAFLVFFCWFVPRIFYYNQQFDRLYYYVLTLTPFVILALALAFRLGGGAPGEVRRVAYASLLLMLSGLEDLAFLVLTPHTDPRFWPIPEVWSWASHMTVFLGHPPSRAEAFAFIAVHLVLAGLVLFLPGRALARLGRRGRG